jgi:hypothetical protein
MLFCVWEANEPCSHCLNQNNRSSDCLPSTHEFYLPSINRHFKAMSKKISWYSGGNKILSVLNDITKEKNLDEMIHQARDKLVVLNSLTGNEIINQIFVLSGYLEAAQDTGLGSDRAIYIK